VPFYLDVLGVECSYGAVKVIDGMAFSIKQGCFAGIIGPNGSGKSTLLRCISRALKPVRGTVLLEGESLYKMSPREAARKMAVVPQETAVNFPFTVEEIIMMGRSPHLGRFQAEGKRDYEITGRSMDLTNTRHLAGRQVTAISGGERQRVIIAKALAQEPELILLDEPTSHLDINQQVEILSLLQRMNREGGLTILAVFHDLNLAAQFCDLMILMQKGKAYRVGKPEDVLTVDSIKEVYGTRVLIKKHPVTGRPTVFLLTRREGEVPGKGRIHVVCGGGAGAAVLGLLAEHGFAVTAGVLNMGDIDWETAKFLELEMTEEAPFSDISDRSYRENMEMIQGADACVLVSIPFGRGNLKNLEAVSRACAWGKPVLLVEEREIGERDFTGGEATLMYNQLKEQGAVVLQGGAEVPEVLAGLLQARL
jgi:iron complex transport system ATP-binding protein